MAGPLTLSQIFETRRPAYSEGHLYRFVPGKGFDRVNTLTRGWGIGWLPMRGTPASRFRWYHESKCDCQYCRPGVRAVEPTEEQRLKAA